MTQQADLAALRLALREAIVGLPQPTLGLAGGVNRGAVIDTIERVFAAGVRVTGDALRQSPLVTGDADGTRTRATYVAVSDAAARRECHAGCDLCRTLNELDTDAAAPLRELLREAIEVVHQAEGARRHHDPTDKTGWNVKGIETCADPLCVAALAALTPEAEA